MPSLPNKYCMRYNEVAQASIPFKLCQKKLGYLKAYFSDFFKMGIPLE